MKKRHAFTLIEMLVVIAIIGIIAGMVVNGIGHAKAAQRNALVNAQKQSLMLMIGNYQSKLNYYPPDNGYMANTNVVNYAANYDAYAATNPLLYELTGGTNIDNTPLFDGTVYIEKNYNAIFRRPTINNANPDEPHNFFNPAPQRNSYTNYSGSVYNGLIVPVPLYNTPFTNYWHYDSSSPNRHNLQSYDLWAEYITSKNTVVTNGNW